MEAKASCASGSVLPRASDIASTFVCNELGPESFRREWKQKLCPQEMLPLPGEQLCTGWNLEQLPPLSSLPRAAATFVG